LKIAGEDLFHDFSSGEIRDAESHSYGSASPRQRVDLFAHDEQHDQTRENEK
jgi:hypothetical protein